MEMGGTMTVADTEEGEEEEVAVVERVATAAQRDMVVIDTVMARGRVNTIVDTMTAATISGLEEAIGAMMTVAAATTTEAALMTIGVADVTTGTTMVVKAAMITAVVTIVAASGMTVVTTGMETAAAAITTEAVLTIDGMTAPARVAEGVWEGGRWQEAEAMDPREAWAGCAQVVWAWAWAWVVARRWGVAVVGLWVEAAAVEGWSVRLLA
jgi:hypothetical protein